VHYRYGENQLFRLLDVESRQQGYGKPGTANQTPPIPRGQITIRGRSGGLLEDFCIGRGRNSRRRKNVGDPNAGEVKLDTKIKDADVFIDGSLAGATGHLKTMQLRAGSYDLQIRAPGRVPFEQKIYVVAGKVLTLHPDLAVVTAPGT
jgi:hypothetical protein